ncbi:hypothetical protein E2C01_039322 [Portunus trituberculatus]|uniref:Uncharacterized protein n=1 Tax=Portunus trituberculatus TaxID=210409 RepID=A0A5B7FJD9_PORTR|nr:hypothetical protein [Portunus trituberculatus]
MAPKHQKDLANTPSILATSGCSRRTRGSLALGCRETWRPVGNSSCLSELRRAPSGPGDSEALEFCHPEQEGRGEPSRTR